MIFYLITFYCYIILSYQASHVNIDERDRDNYGGGGGGGRDRGEENYPKSYGGTGSGTMGRYQEDSNSTTGQDVRTLIHWSRILVLPVKSVWFLIPHDSPLFLLLTDYLSSLLLPLGNDLFSSSFFLLLLLSIFLSFPFRLSLLSSSPSVPLYLSLALPFSHSLFLSLSFFLSLSLSNSLSFTLRRGELSNSSWKDWRTQMLKSKLIVGEEEEKELSPVLGAYVITNSDRNIWILYFFYDVLSIWLVCVLKVVWWMLFLICNITPHKHSS